MFFAKLTFREMEKQGWRAAPPLDVPELERYAVPIACAAETPGGARLMMAPGWAMEMVEIAKHQPGTTVPDFWWTQVIHDTHRRNDPDFAEAVLGAVRLGGIKAAVQFFPTLRDLP